jgi:hypothetical protein
MLVAAGRDRHIYCINATALKATMRVMCRSLFGKKLLLLLPEYNNNNNNNNNRLGFCGFHFLIYTFLWLINNHSLTIAGGKLG